MCNNINSGQLKRNHFKNYSNTFTTSVLYDQPSSADVIRRLGKNISVLHLNDNNKLKDQHKIPMTGDIDWKDVLDALEEIDYQGYYNMELNLGWFGFDMIEETAAFAIKVMRNMLKDR